MNEKILRLWENFLGVQQKIIQANKTNIPSERKNPWGDGKLYSGEGKNY